MHRVLVVAIVVLASRQAHADKTYLGGWFGPRFYSNDAALGYIDEAPAHAQLENGIELGLRVSREFFPFKWLVPEFELGISPTSSTKACTPMGLCAAPTDVVWIEPRIQLRFELMPGRRIQPFLLVGAGSPAALSSARMTFNSGIVGDGFAGGGVRFDTYKGFAFRVDSRVSIVPGVDHVVTPEVEIGFGIDLIFGGRRVHAGRATEQHIATNADRDNDGIPDAQDKCPDRPEDIDQFEDSDGCPDIDNDMDRVLDVADKCPATQETYNGFDDDDGCPDIVPADVEALVGTIEGLFYADGETAVRESAKSSLQRITKVLLAHSSVKIVLVGHTDDREAKAFATPPEEGQPPPPDVDTLASQLSHARAEAVRQELESEGVPSGRIVVDGVGAEEPVADNGTPKGRLANRRVELRLFVPR